MLDTMSARAATKSLKRVNIEQSYFSNEKRYKVESNQP